MKKNRDRILIVDDNEINRMILTNMLQDEFDIVEAGDGKEAVEIMKRGTEDITLMLLDIVMPNIDGFGVLARMNSNHWIDDIPVIIISAEGSPSYMRRAFDLGAVDYINRPFEQFILIHRIKNTIMLYAKQKQLIDIVVNQTIDREHDNNMMIAILSHIVEFRNGESGKHVQNINILTELILNQLISKTDRYDSVLGDARTIRLASSLHDIGKIGIPDQILNKPGKLTKEEFEIIKTHSALGAEFMQKMELFRDEKLVEYSYQICRWHHERWDGKGYPDGLKGDDIPIAAQIVSVADVYDALTSERCYKPAFTHEKAMEMIKNGECGAFNPILHECLSELGDLLQRELAKPVQGNEHIKAELVKDLKRRIRYDS